MLAYGEAISVARSFAQKHGYDVNPEQELTALGAANLATGLAQGSTRPRRTSGPWSSIVRSFRPLIPPRVRRCGYWQDRLNLAKLPPH
jgi:hypothetical protein